MGEETISALVDHVLVRGLADLFRLSKCDLLRLERFAERSAQKLIDAIKKRRHVEFGRFIYALGIPEVDGTVARGLAQHFRNLESFRQTSREELDKVSGIGPKMSQAIVNFFGEKRNQRAIDALLEAGVQIIETKKLVRQLLTGKKFVFTGSLERFSRSEAQALVEGLGGQVSSTLTSRTDYLVVGTEPGKKMADAKSAGVKTLSEKGFIELLRESGAGVV